MIATVCMISDGGIISGSLGTVVEVAEERRKQEEVCWKKTGCVQKPSLSTPVL
jgi:hypothetical protein